MLKIRVRISIEFREDSTRQLWNNLKWACQIGKSRKWIISLLLSPTSKQYAVFSEHSDLLNWNDSIQVWWLFCWDSTSRFQLCEGKCWDGYHLSSSVWFLKLSRNVLFWFLTRHRYRLCLEVAAAAMGPSPRNKPGWELRLLLKCTLCNENVWDGPTVIFTDMYSFYCCRKLLISGMSAITTEQDLRDYFDPFCKVIEAVIMPGEIIFLLVYLYYLWGWTHWNCSTDCRDSCWPLL